MQSAVVSSKATAARKMNALAFPVLESCQLLRGAQPAYVARRLPCNLPTCSSEQFRSGQQGIAETGTTAQQGGSGAAGRC